MILKKLIIIILMIIEVNAWVDMYFIRAVNLLKNNLIWINFNDLGLKTKEF